MATYKRVKHRNKQSGQNRTNWEYFEIFDNVYGSSHVLAPPDEILYSSLLEQASSLGES